MLNWGLPSGISRKFKSPGEFRCGITLQVVIWTKIIKACDSKSDASSGSGKHFMSFWTISSTWNFKVLHYNSQRLNTPSQWTEAQDADIQESRSPRNSEVVIFVEEFGRCHGISETITESERRRWRYYHSQRYQILVVRKQGHPPWRSWQELKLHTLLWFDMENLWRHYW